MKYYILFSLFFLSLSPSVFSAFPQNTTLIKQDSVFQKSQGVQNLKVHEDYSINPFTSSTIIENKVVCTGNSCPCGASGCSTITSYTVDGKTFNTAHPLFKNALTIRKNWSEETDGIETRIEYRENTYIQTGSIYKPNQEVTVRKYYIVSYSHDTSYPTCGEVKMYNDEALTKPFSYNGGWLNAPKYFTMVCSDAQTGCYCAPDDNSCIKNAGKVVSTPQLLGHKIQPSTSFTNKVLLNDTSCQPGGSFQTVLYDLKTPKVDLLLGSYNFDLNFENFRTYEEKAGKKYDGIEIPGILRFSKTTTGVKKAQSKDISLSIEDTYLAQSVHGVSGIKNYSLEVFQTKDHTFKSISQQKLSSCSKTESFIEYNTNGNKTISDKKNIPISCDALQKSGEYKFFIKTYDWAGNETTVTAFLKIYPGDISASISTLILSGSTDKYANNKDEYEYALSLKDSFGNAIINRNILKIEQSITGYSLGQNILVKSGKSALITRSPDGLKTGPAGNHKLMLKSLKPGTYTERFKVDYTSWGDDGIQNQAQKSVSITNGQNNTFSKPFSAGLTLVQTGAMLQLGTEQRYQIKLQNIGTVTSFSNGSLDISPSSMKFSSDHYFDTFSASTVDKAFSPSDYLTYFDATINTKNAQSALLTPTVQSENINISYNLGGETIVYPLDTFSLGGCADISTVGLKVIGNIQGDGKTTLTGQDKNFSNVSQASLRTEIEKNALTLIKAMTSGTTINKVHYQEGDISISGTLPYETLVVKNGNVIITGDLNTVAKSKLGIIVLRDTGYNTAKDFNTTGNIYVTKNVKAIDAILYADGAFRSAYPDGTAYEDIDLGLKLKLYGSLFSKNTVGGAINAGGSYILPGSASTTDLQLAKIYDLNYIRRNKACGPNEYSFLIEYNPSVQLNPPKGFFTK